MNIATIIVAAIVAVAFISIVTSEVRKRKAGKCSCSCSCDGCSGCGK